MNIPSFHSHRTQLIVTALTASFVTAGLLSAYNNYVKTRRRRGLDQDILSSIASQGTRNDSIPGSEDKLVNYLERQHREQRTTPYDEDLIREQLARNYAFFGDEGMAKIRSGTVVVVGCGGVGSWAAVMLVRSCA